MADHFDDLTAVEDEWLLADGRGAFEEPPSPLGDVAMPPSPLGGIDSAFVGSCCACADAVGPGEGLVLTCCGDGTIHVKCAQDMCKAPIVEWSDGDAEVTRSRGMGDVRCPLCRSTSPFPLLTALALLEHCHLCPSDAETWRSAFAAGQAAAPAFPRGLAMLAALLEQVPPPDLESVSIFLWHRGFVEGLYRSLRGPWSDFSGERAAPNAPEMGHSVAEHDDQVVAPPVVAENHGPVVAPLVVAQNDGPVVAPPALHLRLGAQDAQAVAARRRPRRQAKAKAQPQGPLQPVQRAVPLPGWHHIAEVDEIMAPVVFAYGGRVLKLGREPLDVANRMPERDATALEGKCVAADLATRDARKTNWLLVRLKGVALLDVYTAAKSCSPGVAVSARRRGEAICALPEVKKFLI